MEKKTIYRLIEVSDGIYISTFFGFGSYFYLTILVGINVMLSLFLSFLLSSGVNVLLFTWILNGFKLHDMEQRRLEIKEKHKQRK